jgi:hypothetical protein
MHAMMNECHEVVHSCMDQATRENGDCGERIATNLGISQMTCMVTIIVQCVFIQRRCPLYAEYASNVLRRLYALHPDWHSILDRAHRTVIDELDSVEVDADAAQLGDWQKDEWASWFCQKEGKVGV